MKTTPINWFEFTGTAQKSAVDKMKAITANLYPNAEVYLIYYPDATSKHAERCRIDAPVTGPQRHSQTNISREEAEAAIKSGDVEKVRTKRTGAEVWKLKA